MLIYSKSLESLGHYDVVVVGSGAAGSTAAIAAARGGARTLLLERHGFLGGTSTAVLDTFYGFYTPGSKNLKVVGGIPDGLLAELKKIGPVLERPNTYGAGTGVTYHPDHLKVAWERLARSAGVKALLHSVVQDVLKKGERVTGLVVATRMGLRTVECGLVIDASGDADVCAFAEVPFELAGEINPAQTLTTTFRMANVDLTRRQQISKTEFHDLLARASESGRYCLPRKEGSDHITPVDHMTATVMTRLSSTGRRGGRLVNASDPEFLSAAEMEGREQALEYVRFLQDCVPGYERAELACFGAQIGVRETRRVYGLYRLTREDVLSARQFEDQIGLCGAPIEDRQDAGARWQYLPDGQCVGIPYRTLVPQKIENALVAGRCFSATHDAHASVRSMAQCMAMGQAAGVAAALAIQRGVSPSVLPADQLRSELKKTGAILEMEQAGIGNAP